MTIDLLVITVKDWKTHGVFNFPKYDRNDVKPILSRSLPTKLNLHLFPYWNQRLQYHSVIPQLIIALPSLYLGHILHILGCNCTEQLGLVVIG